MHKVVDTFTVSMVLRTSYIIRTSLSGNGKRYRCLRCFQSMLICKAYRFRTLQAVWKRYVEGDAKGCPDSCLHLNDF